MPFGSLSILVRCKSQSTLKTFKDNQYNNCSWESRGNNAAFMSTAYKHICNMLLLYLVHSLLVSASSNILLIHAQTTFIVKSYPGLMFNSAQILSILISQWCCIVFVDTEGLFFAFILFVLF